MKKLLQKLWNDPVGSNLIANALWTLLIIFVTGLVIFLTKIYNSISFTEAWDVLLDFTARTKSFTYGEIIAILIIFGFILINRKPFFKLLKSFIKIISGVGNYQWSNEIEFTNKNKDQQTLRPFKTRMSWNDFIIKPLNHTLHWSLMFYFSHDYDILSSNDFDSCPYILLSKNRDENRLFIEIFDKENNKINLDNGLFEENYYDQEFRLHFDFDEKLGGTVVTINRLEKELFRTQPFFGYEYARMIIGANEFDYRIKVKYNRYE